MKRSTKKYWAVLGLCVLMGALTLLAGKETNGALATIFLLAGAANAVTIANIATATDRRFEKWVESGGDSAWWAKRAIKSVEK